MPLLYFNRPGMPGMPACCRVLRVPEHINLALQAKRIYWQPTEGRQPIVSQLVERVKVNHLYTK